MRKITIGQQCVGSGQCEMFAPEVFEVGADSRAHIRSDVDWRAVDHEAVDEALVTCPTRALEEIR